MKDEKIFITGGAGFLGQSVVKKLLEAGFDPTKIVIPRKADIADELSRNRYNYLKTI